MTTDPKHDASLGATLGPNEWLVDEIYEQYVKDRDSVDPAWWDFFADYRHENRRVTRSPPVPPLGRQWPLRTGALRLGRCR